MYLYFYNATSASSKLWANNDRNNRISHTAISLNANEPPIGFYPDGYTLETKTDIAYVIRCCCYSDSEMSQMRYFIESRSTANETWYMNGPNCATFANDTVRNKGDAKINTTWRTIKYQPVVKLNVNIFTNQVEPEIVGYSHAKSLPRPETFRREVMAKGDCCSVIYSGR